MSSLFNAFVVVLSFVLVIKVSAIDFRIIGGFHAPEEYGRFHASVQNLTGHHVCGGAVVSQWFVVSAAHCVHKANPRFIKIVAGTNNLDIGGKRCDVSTIIVHRRYNTTSRQHDIALLKTRSPFDLQIIKPLKLSRRHLHEGDDIVLVGFGASEPHGSSSRVMYTLEMPVFNQEVCEFAMRYSRPVTKEMFCTFTKIGQGTCHGDSGSPLVKGDELVGIVSWGIPCAVGFPDVHTRLAPYVDWIKMHIHEGYCGAPKRQFFMKK
ncbi:chymotrypsin-1-like [Spodoptera litura]|uniref:Chymotrypsin-1-like n=1 Tax=Spodoptera litura TaxID=69820 RepID=A0A9J7IV19_SPOLT|nr:chymotrypsin-1-like [Spodoptera litura]